ncbi:MAG: F0F1 ATP synthase subunit delta [Nocardioidaceae bacterium]
MQAGSAKSMAAVLEKTDEVLRSDADAGQVGSELFAFVLNLDHGHGLRRALTEPAVPAEAKRRLVHALVEGKVSAAAVDVIDVAVSNRWSQGRDLADALEQASVTAHVTKADRAGQLDALEDNLFRFSRIAEGNSGLREVLSDREMPLEGKRALLHRLLDGKVDETTTALLAQAVAARHRSLTGVLDTYQKVAARRRDRVVATVWVAAPIDEQQRERLAGALSREFDRPVHVNIVIEPSVLGGVRVAIGDEVIDSTIETRLKQAQRLLEH